MIQARLRKRFPAGRESSPFSLDVEFTASRGITVLFGPSGAGKTITLDSIAGFVRPDEGRILLDDQLLFDGAAGVHLPPQQRHCGYVFQNYALFPHMTLRDNLLFAAAHWPRIERRRRVAEMLERFRLTEVAGRKPGELSGGQKQRGSIARALVATPRTLLLDEPARGLDAPLRIELYDILLQVRAEFGTPILLVTHSLDECLTLGDDMLVFDGGRIVQSGPPLDVADKPVSLEVARLLGIYNILPVEIRALDPSRNSSQLRFGEFDLEGRYYPGHLRGDKVTVCVSPARLKAVPKVGRPSPNQVPATLTRAIELSSMVRLEFAGNLAVEMPRAEFERVRQNADWCVEFPPDALRVLS